MNILVLTNIYPHENETTTNRTKVIAYFAHEWQRQGHNVVVLVNSSRFPRIYYYGAKVLQKQIQKKYSNEISDLFWIYENHFVDHEISVINLPIMKFLPGGRFSGKALKKQVVKIVSHLDKKGFSPDVITGHWLNPQLFLVAQLGEIYRCKTAFVFHGDSSEKLCRKHMAQKNINFVRNIGFRSRSSLNSAKNYLTFPQEPFLCFSGIPDHYISESVEPKSFSDNTTYLMCAGRLVPYKNIGTVIRAIAKACSNIEYALYIAGEGPLKDTLKSLIAEEKIEHRVTLLGRIPREELQLLMKKCHIFVLISDNETFGLVYLEAMLQGCIVIASRFGGVDGIIVDGENGFLCEQGNEKQLIMILMKILTLSNERKDDISQRAIETAKNYSDSKVSKRYLEEILK